MGQRQQIHSLTDHLHRCTIDDDLLAWQSGFKDNPSVLRRTWRAWYRHFSKLILRMLGKLLALQTLATRFLLQTIPTINMLATQASPSFHPSTHKYYMHLNRSASGMLWRNKSCAIPMVWYVYDTMGCPIVTILWVIATWSVCWYVRHRWRGRGTCLNLVSAMNSRFRSLKMRKDACHADKQAKNWATWGICTVSWMVGLMCEISSSKLVNQGQQHDLHDIDIVCWWKWLSLRLYSFIPKVALFFNNKMTLTRQLIHLDKSCWDRINGKW